MHLATSESPRPAPARLPNVALWPGQLLSLARGFACLFWGIPAGLVLFSVQIEAHLGAAVRLPALGLGLLITLYGLLLLQRAGPLSMRWEHRLTKTMLLCLALLCLAPFLSWWRLRPEVPYFAANVLLMAGLTLWGLLELNGLTAELARLLCEPAFHLEARLCRWAVILFSVLPLLYAGGLIWALSHQTDLPAFAGPTLWLRIPIWVFVPALLPFTLTMAMAWKAKELCLAILRDSAKVPAAPAG